MDWNLPYSFRFQFLEMTFLLYGTYPTPLNPPTCGLPLTWNLAQQKTTLKMNDSNWFRLNLKGELENNSYLRQNSSDHPPDLLTFYMWAVENDQLSHAIMDLFQTSIAIFCCKVVYKFRSLHVTGTVKHFILKSPQIWSKVKNLCYVGPLFHWLMPSWKQNYGRPYRSEHLCFTNQIMHHLSSLILHATFTQCNSAECLSFSDNWCYLLSL